MIDRDKINAMIRSGRTAEAAALLAGPADRDAWAAYMLGRIAWKEGRKAEAISLYEHAVALDPASDAAVALEQAREVMQFYNKDLYNP